MRWRQLDKKPRSTEVKIGEMRRSWFGEGGKDERSLLHEIRESDRAATTGR
jgi:hypothetical protein